VKSFIINGKFMADRMQGIVRYSREITKALDTLLDGEIKVELIVPNNATDIPSYKNINVKKIGEKTGIYWEQTEFRKYVKKHQESICINLCNVCPFFVNPGVTVIHDIMYKANPSHYTTLRNRLSRYWHMLQYRYIFSHEKVILTVSLYSKREIESYYPKSKGKISIVPCAWQHVKEYHESADWNKRYPFLESGNYYFSLATLSKNKNGIWIIDAAKKNPNSIFAIAGKHYETDDCKIPDNVRMLGFVSDEDACALIKNCKAFIFPSVYEGFGLPPLEALALGATVISSDAASLPEVLGKSSHYIDPKNPNVDLEKILSTPLNEASEALDKFSWEKSAEKLKQIMLKF
jgi:glycosyltransferase involved in cell wall biosynthesis